MFQLGVCWAISACRTFPKYISKAVFVSPGGQRKAHTSQRYRADMQSTTDGNIELWYFESCISMWNCKLKPSAISPSSISKLVLHHVTPKEMTITWSTPTTVCPTASWLIGAKAHTCSTKVLAGVWSMVFRSTMANLSRFRKKKMHAQTTGRVCSPSSCSNPSINLQEEGKWSKLTKETQMSKLTVNASDSIE